MAKILNVETSTTVCSVAVSVNGELKSLHEINEGYSHAEQLEILIQKALQDSQIPMSELDAVAVSKGPGSYTGLRIGVSLAKGICYGANIPLITVSTLQAMAFHKELKSQEDGLKIPMLDARRMEVYTCALNSDNEFINPIEALVINEESFVDVLNQKCYFFGPGMEKCKEILSTHQNALFVDDVMPSAAYMIPVSERKFKSSTFEDVAYFEPFYLKDFVAGKPKKLL